MELMLRPDVRKLEKQFNYRHKILLSGSCFTEHIGNSLAELKFEVLQNPNGILYDPISIGSSLISYINNKRYSENDLFELNGLWQSWQHHGRFSNPEIADCLKKINSSQQQAHDFLTEADWLIITFGTAFSYRLVQNNPVYADSLSNPNEIESKSSIAVANCHRAPSNWFNKHFLTIDEIVSAMDNCIHQLFHFNKKIKIVFTVSPVRHIRDGIVENNRSKARLLEAVHHLVGKFEKLFYFPAYELVIDVLRDYRFYDSDLVHPNKLATEFVFERFTEACIDGESKEVMKLLTDILSAKSHRAFHPSGEAHRKFLTSNLQKVKELQQKFPFLNLESEFDYFSTVS